MIIKPEIFEKFNNVVCALSTRIGGVSKGEFGMNLSYKTGDEAGDVTKNKELFFKRIGISEERVVFQNQVHSTNYRIVKEPGKIMKNDALITGERNLYLAVSIADCAPVLMYFSDVEIAAGIHSGWKGTADKITSEVTEAVLKKFGSKPENIYSYIGQCISSEFYEVGEEVAELFSDEVKKKRNGKWYIDIRKDNFIQLKKFGIPEGNIEVSNYCTYRDRELFHSYRRDGNRSGRMQAIIGML